MDLESIFHSSFSWVSLKRVFWFVLFFWISLPFIIIIPQFFESGAVYSGFAKSLAFVLYDVLYVSLILGVILLIQFCLAHKKESVAPIGLRKIIDIIFLVFVELFYTFVWNIDVRFRRLQVLLIISSAVLGYLFYLSFNTFLLILFSWSLFAYFFLVIKNFVLVFFSTSIFCHRSDLGIKEAVRESWSLVHGRIGVTFSAIIVAFFLAFILFSFVALALGAFSTIIFRFFFINSIALNLGFKVASAFGLGVALIAYHFMIAEIFSQLSRHKEASHSIKRILSRRILYHKGHAPVSPKRSFAKKKRVKRKSRR